MLRLNTSVGFVNILLWVFTELFIVLMTFQATRLIGRYMLNRSLSQGHKLELNKTLSFIDSLPYNGDLQPLRPSMKLLLTAARLGGIALSVYLGFTLDGEIRHVRAPHMSKVTALATRELDRLTINDGKDIAAMAKLSCLRILSNNDVELYRGYMDSADENSVILCEDGHSMFTTVRLLTAEIRPETRYDTALDMSGLDIMSGGDVPGLTRSSNRIRYEKEGQRVDMVLHVNTGTNCTFGLYRSTGGGFVSDVYLQMRMQCNVVIRDYKRILQPKPYNMPPRMSFLHQVIDAIVVQKDTPSDPEIMGTDVVATISTEGTFVALTAAVVTTVVCLVMWVLLRRGSLKPDVLSPGGVATLWGAEKWGGESSRDRLYIAFDEGKMPYLGSMDGLNKLQVAKTWRSDAASSSMNESESDENVVELSEELSETSSMHEFELDDVEDGDGSGEEGDGGHEGDGGQDVC